ncbi:MAG: hypothetical protein HY895_21520 [Deltaproteobacteria bacterium]|nr:hypothetical protein [Deltaproteobacteria bacterium]
MASKQLQSQGFKPPSPKNILTFNTNSTPSDLNRQPVDGGDRPADPGTDCALQSAVICLLLPPARQGGRLFRPSEAITKTYTCIANEILDPGAV